MTSPSSNGPHAKSVAIDEMVENITVVGYDRVLDRLRDGPAPEKALITQSDNNVFHIRITRRVLVAIPEELAAWVRPRP